MSSENKVQLTQSLAKLVESLKKESQIRFVTAVHQKLQFLSCLAPTVL